MQKLISYYFIEMLFAPGSETTHYLPDWTSQILCLLLMLITVAYPMYLIVQKRYRHDVSRHSLRSPPLERRYAVVVLFAPLEFISLFSIHEVAEPQTISFWYHLAIWLSLACLIAESFLLLCAWNVKNWLFVAFLFCGKNFILYLCRINERVIY